MAFLKLSSSLMIFAIDECKVGLGKLKDMANHFALTVYT